MLEQLQSHWQKSPEVLSRTKFGFRGDLFQKACIVIKALKSVELILTGLDVLFGLCLSGIMLAARVLPKKRSALDSEAE